MCYDLGTIRTHIRVMIVAFELAHCLSLTNLHSIHSLDVIISSDVTFGCQICLWSTPSRLTSTSCGNSLKTHRTWHTFTSLSPVSKARQMDRTPRYSRCAPPRPCISRRDRRSNTRVGALTMPGTDTPSPRSQSNDFIRDIWGSRPLVSAGAYTRESAIRVAETKGDLIAFGRPFIGNVRSRPRSRHSQIRDCHSLHRGCPLNCARRTPSDWPGALVFALATPRLRE